jgi:hypothetical protein
MKRKPIVPLLLLLGTVAILGYSGCSVIGLCAGASIDNARPDYDTIPGSHVAIIERGKDIKLTMKTGEELKGEYLGVGRPADSQYARVYNEYRERYKKELLLPALGDSISTVTLESAKECKGEFLGFDNQYIWLRARMWPPNRVRIDMSVLKRITDRNGNLIEVGRLITLSSAGEIPALSGVALKANSDTLCIPNPEVDRIEVPVDKNAKWMGLGVGVVIDAVIIVAIADAMHGPLGLNEVKAK